MDTSKGTTSESFLQHVFSLSDDDKHELLNSLQYGGIALLPVLLMIKFIQYILPTVDETKGNVELGLEILVQFFLVITILWFIHRIITYFPTLSHTEYSKIPWTGNVLGMLVIMLTLQTRVGEKATILYSRFLDAWNGTSSTSGRRQKKAGGGGGQQQQQQQQGWASPGLMMPTPTSPPSSSHVTSQDMMMNQQSQQQDMPMIGAAMPSSFPQYTQQQQQIEGFSPQPANAMSSSFASWR